MRNREKKEILTKIDTEVLVMEEVLLESQEVLLDFTNEDDYDKLRFKERLEYLMNFPVRDEFDSLFHAQGFIKGITYARMLLDKGGK